MGLISENREPRYADLDIITNKQLLLMQVPRSWSAYKAQICGAGADFLSVFLAIVIPLSVICFYIALVVYFAIYAFANPNNACFYGTSEAGVEFIKGV